MRSGVTLNWSANASGWATQAWTHGAYVDGTPTVGAIAQWNSGVSGHVAVVDGVDATGITVTMDDYYTARPYPNGYTEQAHIATNTAAWPDNFIHF